MSRVVDLASIKKTGGRMKRLRGRWNLRRGNNNNNNKPSVFPPSGVWGGKMYAVHTSTSEEVERLFPIDPRLKARDTTQTHSKAQKQIT